MMKRNSRNNLLSIILCIVLIAAIALCTTGCGSKEPEQPAVQSKTFSFVVEDLEGKQTPFEITTDEKTVGAALLKEGLIQGDESDFGLYVKEVNGIKADWDADQTYWAFYVNGEYATVGVDATDVEEGATYSFVLTK